MLSPEDEVIDTIDKFRQNLLDERSPERVLTSMTLSKVVKKNGWVYEAELENEYGKIDDQ